MLNLIFQGYLEWLYSLLVDSWTYFSSELLGVMSRDFDFLQAYIPILGDMMGMIQAAGWALLLGNFVFQALKSMTSGLGFEGDDPRLLFSRTFVFAFLLMASPQICRLGLGLTARIVTLLDVPDSMEPSFIDQSVFGTLEAAWLLTIVCGVIVMFKILRLIMEIAEQYVVLAALTVTAPLAFAMGGSRNTAPIFNGWCRMYGSMCLLMVTDMLFFKLLASVLATVPVGPYVLPWMVLILAIVKVARKADAIITRIGLNPAITGGGPGRSVPGMLAFTVARTAANQVVKTVGGNGNGGGGGKGAKASGKAKPSSARFNGTRFAGSSQPSGGGYTYQSAKQQSSSDQSTAQQTAGWQSSTAHSATRQNDTRQENMSHINTQRSTGGGTTVNSTSKTNQDAAQGRKTRKSSVPSGVRRSPGYVPPMGGIFYGTAQKTAPGPVGAGTGPASPQQFNGVRPGAAGKTVKGGAPAPKPDAAGSRFTHSASQTVDSRTADSRNQTTVQTAATMGKGTSAPKTPPSAVPRLSRTNGPTVRDTPPGQGDTRSTRRRKPDGAAKTAAAPVPDTVRSRAEGPASRNTQRPADPSSRSGRNVSPATAAPPANGTRSGAAAQERTSGDSCTVTERISASTVRQERTADHSRTTANRVSSIPAPQGQRKADASAPRPVKGSTPTIRPGGAGTAPTAKQAAGQARTVKARTTRAKPVQPPLHRPKGGNGRG